MEHYFLHVRDGAEFLRDPDGCRMPNLRAAELESIESARELMSQSIVTAGRIGINRAFEICDRGDKTLQIVPFLHALARHDEVRLSLDARNATPKPGLNERVFTASSSSREARWRYLAEEARVTANTVEDADERKLLLKIAVTYQQLAERTKGRKNRGKTE
jgi:hypothetical protein